MVARQAGSLILGAWLSSSVLAQSYRVILNDVEVVLQGGSRLAGPQGGLSFAPPVPALEALIASPPATPPPTAPPDQKLRGANRRVMPADPRPASRPPSGPTRPARAGPDFDTLDNWLRTRHGINDPAQIGSIWTYFLSEGSGLILAPRAANAVAAYCWSTRDNLGGRIDPRGFDMNYQGPARINNVGIWIRSGPGGSPDVEIPEGTTVTVGATPGKAGWHHVESTVGNGWVSMEWLDF